MNIMTRLWNTTSCRIGSSLLVVVVFTLAGLAAPATADEHYADDSVIK